MGQKRPKIKLTVIDRRGKMGCHRGHRVGQTFDYDTERGGTLSDGDALCLSLY